MCIYIYIYIKYLLLYIFTQVYAGAIRDSYVYKYSNVYMRVCIYIYMYITYMLLYIFTQVYLWALQTGAGDISA